MMPAQTTEHAGLFHEPTAGTDLSLLNETPHFPFGQGLNPLTSFALSDLAVHKGKDQQGLLLQANVTNTGSRAGDEVVMAFFSPPVDLPASEPACKLRQQMFNFERVHLQPKASQQVEFLIAPTIFQLHNSNGMLKLFPGKYDVRVTNGDVDLHMSILIDERRTMQVVQEGSLSTKN
jgi:hypothetical protein